MDTSDPDARPESGGSDDGGVVFMLSACIGCGVPFTYNPLKVPSVPAALSPTGQKEPVCKRCWTRRQEYRRQLDLPLEEIAADAYEPLPVDEFPIEGVGQ